MRRRWLLYSLALVLTCPLVAQDLTNYEKILLPAYCATTVTGVGGSTFRTWLYEYSEVDISYFPGYALPDPTVPTIVVQPAFNPDFTPLGYGPPTPTGRFLYIEKSHVDDVSLQYFLLASDASGQASDQYTALPVVRQPLTSVSRILSIPVRPIIQYDSRGIVGTLVGYAYRNHLRVYDFGGDGSGEVTVEMFHGGMFGRTGPLGKKNLKLDQRGGDDPSFPWYGETDLNPCLPFSTHTPCSTLDLRVEISPVSASLAYWAFVTTTDNASQRVTVFESQPPRHP